MIAPEFARPFALPIIGSQPLNATIEATATERAALARRFDLLDLSALTASAKLLLREGQPIAEGHFSATLTQACVATGAPVPAHLHLAFKIRFVDEAAITPAEPIELRVDDDDDMPLTDGNVDLGEAVAQSLALALDPFPRSPDAAQFLSAAGVMREGDEPRGAFSGLKTLLGN